MKPINMPALAADATKAKCVITPIMATRSSIFATRIAIVSTYAFACVISSQSWPSLTGDGSGGSGAAVGPRGGGGACASQTATATGGTMKTARASWKLRAFLDSCKSGSKKKKSKKAPAVSAQSRMQASERALACADHNIAALEAAERTLDASGAAML